MFLTLYFLVPMEKETVKSRLSWLAYLSLHFLLIEHFRNLAQNLRMIIIAKIANPTDTKIFSQPPFI